MNRKLKKKLNRTFCLAALLGLMILIFTSFLSVKMSYIKHEISQAKECVEESDCTIVGNFSPFSCAVVTNKDSAGRILELIKSYPLIGEKLSCSGREKAICMQGKCRIAISHNTDPIAKYKESISWLSYENTEYGFAFEYPNKSISNRFLAEKPEEFSEDEILVSNQILNKDNNFYLCRQYEVDLDWRNGELTKVANTFIPEHKEEREYGFPWHIVVLPVASEEKLGQIIKERYGSGCGYGIEPEAVEGETYAVKIIGDGKNLGNPNRFETLGELIYNIYQTIFIYNNRRIHSKLKMPPVLYGGQYNLNNLLDKCV